MATKMIQLVVLSALLGVVAGQNATVCSSAATKTVLSQADADEIGAACPTFTGNILLGDGPPYSRIALNGIQEITGKLTIEDWMWVSGDSLTRVGGSLENINSFTEEISFPALEYVGGGIIFTEVDQYKVSLQRALFPSLKEVNGDLIITGNHYFHELEVPNIERINGLLKLYDERQIASLTMNKLESVGPGGIEIAGYFDGLYLDSLKSVWPKFSIVTMGSGNCSEWDALRQPGGALANVTDYRCQDKCERLYGDRCYCPGNNFPSQSSC